MPACTTDSTGTLGKGLPGIQDPISGAAHSALRKLQSWLSSSPKGFHVKVEPGLPKFLLISSFHKCLLSIEHLLCARHGASSLLKADKSPCLAELTFPSGENKQVDKRGEPRQHKRGENKADQAMENAGGRPWRGRSNKDTSLDPDGKKGALLREDLGGSESWTEGAASAKGLRWE